MKLLRYLNNALSSIQQRQHTSYDDVGVEREREGRVEQAQQPLQCFGLLLLEFAFVPLSWLLLFFVYRNKVFGCCRDQRCYFALTNYHFLVFFSGLERLKYQHFSTFQWNLVQGFDWSVLVCVTFWISLWASGEGANKAITHKILLDLDRLGVVLDRRWLIVNDESKFVTARQIPKLVLIQPSLQTKGSHQSPPPSLPFIPPPIMNNTLLLFPHNVSQIRNTTYVWMPPTCPLWEFQRILLKKMVPFGLTPPPTTHLPLFYFSFLPTFYWLELVGG